METPTPLMGTQGASSHSPKTSLHRGITFPNIAIHIREWIAKREMHVKQVFDEHGAVRINQKTTASPSCLGRPSTATCRPLGQKYIAVTTFYIAGHNWLESWIRKWGVCCSERIYEKARKGGRVEWIIVHEQHTDRCNKMAMFCCTRFTE